jgi:cold shock CspA family protein
MASASPMRHTGKLRSWNDDRGFGFIAPSDGGAELFVHISALPSDRTRPTVGEVLSYELGRGKDGKPKALKVLREAIGPVAERPRAVAASPRRRRSIVPSILGLMFVVAVGAYGYHRFRTPLSADTASQQPKSVQPEATSSAILPTRTFNCNGRIHCSQMTSCAEAKFFIKNCPGTQMDGDNDGDPCEQQWCTHPFAK